MQDVSFKISPRTIRMIGRQNVSSQFVAINELVKNSYDADSASVNIKFCGEVSKGRGRILIEDFGTGMDTEDIIQKWLTIGTDSKEREPTSPKGRIRTGAKGIGRFALDRLGLVGRLISFHDPNQDGLELIIDWRKYDDTDAGFESIKHAFRSVRNTHFKQGTQIYIEKLRDNWSSEDIIDLFEDLSFLLPPFEEENSEFRILLSCQEFPEINGLVTTSKNNNPEFKIISDLSREGNIKHTITHRDGFSREINSKWADITGVPTLFESIPECGALSVQVLFYVQPELVRERGIDVRERAFQKYLQSYRGVKIYRDGFIVKPYGLKNNDWLGLNPRKIRNNEGVVQADLGDYKISNHQIIGSVSISRNSNPNLEDKTNREGLIDNGAFKDLKKFILTSITALEIQRQILEKEQPSRRKQQKNLTVDTSLIDKAVKILHKSSKTEMLPLKQDEDDQELKDKNNEKDLRESNSINDTVDLTSEEADEIVSILESTKREIDERDLLVNLSSIGITFITFSHEIKQDLLDIMLKVNYMKRKGLKNRQLNENLDSISFAANRLDEWSEVILGRAQSNRRKIDKYDVIELCSKLFDDFRKISPNIQFALINEVGSGYTMSLVPMDIESIILNLMSNSVKAFQRSENTRREIILTFLESNGHLKMQFADSATGIKHDGNMLNDQEAQIIFSPLTTLNSYNNSENKMARGLGTGMGLFIVNSICSHNNWQIGLISLNSIGGATFELIFGGKNDE